MDSYEEALIHIEKIQRSISTLMRMPSVFTIDERHLLIDINKNVALLKNALGEQSCEVL